MRSARIKRVLMCRPDHFSVEYVINPWMIPGSVDRKKAMNEWETLVETYRSIGITVEVIDQAEGVPDMVFAADQGIVKGKEVLVSNFTYPERQKERPYYLEWFTSNGFTPKYLPEGHYFEGTGECLLWRNLVFVGTGFRTGKQSALEIGEHLDMDAIPLELTDERFYHIDTCLFPLNDEVVFYYPEAFSRRSQRTLQSIVPRLYPFSTDEAVHFCANSVVSGEHVMITASKGSHTFRSKLMMLGYTVHDLDLTEFLKAGGSAHCLTNVLEWE
ncbi:MAG: dimethylarginine dimethylaminohydrolase family protein [Patescibacteria group bacterium]